MAYLKTTWVDKVTPLSAENLNKIEDGIAAHDVDYIVSQGTTDFWIWRKWNSGVAECWGRVLVDGIDIITPNGNVYRSDPTRNDNLPFTFAATPIFNVTVTGTTSGAIYCTGTGTTTQTPSHYIWKTVAGTNQRFYVNYYVIGRWE